MKTKNNMVPASKTCTCSAIQQCPMHRKPREQQADLANDITHIKPERIERKTTKKGAAKIKKG